MQKIKQRIKKLRAILVLVLAMGMIINPAFMAGSAEAASVTIPSRTVVILEAQDPINGGEVQAGSEVELVVARDVKVNGKRVIKAGTRAYANVSVSQSNNFAGSPSKLVLNSMTTKTVDGRTISLRGTYAVKGKDNMVVSIAVGLLLCPLALLMKGGEKGIAGGTEIKSYVRDDIKVKI